MSKQSIQQKSHYIKPALLMGIVSIALLCNQGCSFLFVSGPPDHVQQPASAQQAQQAQQRPVYFNCTESNFWPIVDLLWAGLNGLGAATAATAEEGEIESPGQVIGVGVAWLVVSGVAAISGFSKVSKCRKAKAEQIQQLSSRAGRQHRLALPQESPANQQYEPGILTPRRPSMDSSRTAQLKMRSR